MSNLDIDKPEIDKPIDQIDKHQIIISVSSGPVHIKTHGEKEWIWEGIVEVNANDAIHCF